ncbi:hypothetical protein EJ03DRAFT_62569 [Teratosphaeria nubilosa]|uniref:Uncharacterized protein n=1 Tax=Teratosphaeria nubilosa TaxID=161662 RepID=A0A6G1KSP0_9PEZI|nr:hypothetical protein EJ03DRAFT_62569 [Teratosphaeria nubilosa]
MDFSSSPVAIVASGRSQKPVDTIDLTQDTPKRSFLRVSKSVGIREQSISDSEMTEDASGVEDGEEDDEFLPTRVARDVTNNQARSEGADAEIDQEQSHIGSISKQPEKGSHDATLLKRPSICENTGISGPPLVTIDWQTKIDRNQYLKDYKTNDLVLGQYHTPVGQLPDLLGARRPKDS